ncbi:unnamed protein product [Pleuronectes platessa]|uniref:Uncharacterized protein n=1 Tax=Pleuronectes platessa TaxID=8262 RepID=A0A9N7UXN4_PLEPL|nr:unnamed protein product [Pleuronectes platessa]
MGIWHVYRPKNSGRKQLPRFVVVPPCKKLEAEIWWRRRPGYVTSHSTRPQLEAAGVGWEASRGGTNQPVSGVRGRDLAEKQSLRSGRIACGSPPGKQRRSVREAEPAVGGYDHFMLRQLYDCCFTVCVIVTLETKFSRVDLFFNACKQRVVKL